MLIHIVCWKYRPETGPDRREEHRSRLKELSVLVPDIESFEVGADILHLERSYDTGLVASFKDRDALDHYTYHVEHQKVAAFGKEISESVVSVDFLTDDQVCYGRTS